MTDADADATMHCHVERATVQPERRDDLDDLLHQMFMRRNHDYVGGQEKMWLKVELVQSLRGQSQVYREALSAKTEGPLPFALGYFRLRDDTLEAVSDTVPAAVSPEVLVRILSEFLQSGARFWFAQADAVAGWEIDGVGEIHRLDDAPPDAWTRS